MVSVPDPSIFVKEKIRPRFAFLLDAPKGQKIRAAIVVSALAALGYVFNSQYGLFLDSSELRCMPEQLYLGYPRNEVLHRGDVVSYRANNRMMLGLMTGRRLAKIVAGLPGDHVVSNEAGFYINGELVGKRNPETLRRLQAIGKTPLNIDQVLQPGELFVVGTLPRSFDSRYWGILSDASVDRQLKAIY